MPRPRADIRAQGIPGTDRYRISFLAYPEWWFNSPCSTPETARAWARRNHDALIARHDAALLFGTLAPGFFDEGSAWVLDQADRGRNRTPATLAIYQGILDNHLMPALKCCDIRTITAAQLDTAIKEAKKKNKSGPLSRGTKNKALDTASFLFQAWRAQGLQDDDGERTEGAGMIAALLMLLCACGIALYGGRI